MVVRIVTFIYCQNNEKVARNYDKVLQWVRWKLRLIIVNGGKLVKMCYCISGVTESNNTSGMPFSNKLGTLIY